MSLRTIIARAGRSVLGDDLYTRLRAGRESEDDFLRRVRGVVHVGANTGQEAQRYESFGLDVVWIEPIPDVFEKLQQHISAFPRQSAFRYLVTDEEDKEYDLHISNNGGASSSILDFSGHSTMWPDVTYTSTITMKGITLGGVLRRERIDLGKFDALVLDTQGSELKVLGGSAHLLPNFRFIKVEVPDFESYKGCCRIDELAAFMMSKNFREYSRIPFMHASNLGTYFDVVYKRQSR